MNRRSRKGLRIALIGPLPPPVNGQSIVMKHMAEKLATRYTSVVIADTSGGRTQGLHRLFVMAGSTWRTWGLILRSNVVYVAVKAGHGMWLTTMTAGLARIVGARIFLHHHSYAYVRTRVFRMAALCRVAGPRAQHIVLSELMKHDLINTMPELQSVIVVNNAGLIDRTLLEVPLRPNRGAIVLGHLSNLSSDKGIVEVVDLACALRSARSDVRLIVGGPAVDQSSLVHLARAARELGDSFEYRGPLQDDAKRAFFADISHFIFPTRYVHEAVPLVLYEALAAGAVCVATNRGAIAEQLDGSPGIVARGVDTFVEESLEALAGAEVRADVSEASRNSYLKALSDSEFQFSKLTALIEYGGFATSSEP